MMKKENKTAPPKNLRLITGVHGLDELLGGGLVANGLYLIEGMPGAGKTILASQIAFNLAREGKSILFVTLIAESHAKLLYHLREFSFYDNEVLARRVLMLSGFNALIEGGLDSLFKFLAENIRQQKADFLVLDGFASAREFAESPRALAGFIHNLNTLLTTTNTTTLLLAPLTGNGPHAEHTLVDGLIELERVSCGLRRAREIEIHKMRGGRHLTGQHIFTIDGDGVSVYPRLETVVTSAQFEPQENRGVVSTGLASLDALMSGGIPRGSSTSVLGAPGIGKTLLGLNFLCAGANAGENGLYVGFYESPARLIAKAQNAGIDLANAIDNGMVQMLWRAPLELFVDELAEQIDQIIREKKIARVFLDGVEGFMQAAIYPERTSEFLTALTILLRARGVTTLLSEELPLFSETIGSRILSVSAVVENILLLRYFEFDAQIRRLISIMKLRESAYDPGIREFKITQNGLEIGEQLIGIDHTLAGNTYPSTKHAQRRDNAT
jgi:circadian clock protein KaiC